MTQTPAEIAINTFTTGIHDDNPSPYTAEQALRLGTAQFFRVYPKAQDYEDLSDDTLFANIKALNDAIIGSQKQSTSNAVYTLIRNALTAAGADPFDNHTARKREEFGKQIERTVEALALRFAPEPLPKVGDTFGAQSGKVLKAVRRDNGMIVVLTLVGDLFYLYKKPVKSSGATLAHGTLEAAMREFDV